MTDTDTLTQKLTQEPKIELLTIDWTSLGGTTLRITNGARDPADTVTFNSLTYLPRRFSITGIGASAGGTQPRPKLVIDNVDRYWYAPARNFDYLADASVTYTVVYRQHLDDGTDPDTSQNLTSQQFIVHQMTRILPTTVEMTLRNPLDVEQVMLGRQMLRHTCARKYRVPDSGTADTFFTPTGDNVCPYTGSSYYKKDGTSSATWTDDDCGQRRSDCRLRFPVPATLPFMGFPSIGSPTA